MRGEGGVSRYQCVMQLVECGALGERWVVFLCCARSFVSGVFVCLLSVCIVRLVNLFAFVLFQSDRMGCMLFWRLRTCLLTST